MDTRSVGLGLPTAMLLFLLVPLIASRSPTVSGVTNKHDSATIDTSTTNQVTSTDMLSLGLVITATVGIDPDGCAPTESINVAPNTRVYYCYQATNIGEVTLHTHSVVDSRADIIWDRHSLELAPGETINTVEARLTLDGVAEQNDRTAVTWTAGAITPTLVISATAEATVNVVDAGIAVTKTAGVVGSGCANAIPAVVPEGSDVAFCFVVDNVGSLPLVRHQLTDPLLELDATFAYTLAPSEKLTITQDVLAEYGVESEMVRREVTRTLANTAHYTATSPEDAAATGAASASDVATTTVSLAEPRVRLTATVGTDENICGASASLTLENPNTDLYFCARVRNEGNVPITHHALSQPTRDLVTEFTRTLEPGAVLTVTNVLLDEVGQPRTLGPASVFDGVNRALSNAMIYTGTSALATGREGQTQAYTVTASSSAYANVASTANPTLPPTSTFTPRAATARPTNTPIAATPTWTPVSPLGTPTVVAQQLPTDTPTATRSYQISLLTTPTPSPQSESPLPLPIAQAAATQEAEATLTALALAGTSVAMSPLATPSLFAVEPPTPSATPSTTETAAALSAPPTSAALAVAIDTAPPPTQRPIQLPPPAPTPDYVMFAARTVDSIVMTATWIWFLVGTLVFFVVAGVLVGLAFWQNERHRFDLVDAGLVEQNEFLFPPPESPQSDGSDTRSE